MGPEAAGETNTAYQLDVVSIENAGTSQIGRLFE